MAPDVPELKKASLAERGTRLLAVQLRVMSVLQFLAGAGYITVAVFLQFPPGDPLTLALWAIGCLAIVTSVFGLFGGCRFRCCLGVYVVLATLATLAQAGFVLYLFIDPKDAEEKIANYQRTRQGAIKENLHTIITVGRWVLLGLLGAQVAAIGLASCLRCCSRGRSYEEFQEEEEAEYDARRQAAAEQLGALKAKLGVAEGAQGGSLGTRSKREISLHALSGSAAEQQQRRQHAMRSSLFERCDGAGEAAAVSEDDAKLESDMEAGKIGTRVATEAGERSLADNPFDAAAASPPQTSPSAWPSATSPPTHPAFKPSWSRAGRH